MYLVHIWFFIQYRAFNLEVFFIPSHMLWAIFIVFGLHAIFSFINNMRNKMKEKRIQTSFFRIIKGVLLSAILIFIIIVPLIIQLNNNWEFNDHSQDTAINDFYANAWEILPNNAILLTQGGVFGHDAFYWQKIYQIRSDVTLPAMSFPNSYPVEVKNKPVFSTTQSLNKKHPGSLPSKTINPDDWFVPVLFGESSENQYQIRGKLVLYEVENSPPAITSEKLDCSNNTNWDIGPFLLSGFDLSEKVVESGSKIDIKLCWKPIGKNIRFLPIISIEIGDKLIASFPLGLGLVEQYQKEIGFARNEFIIDNFSLVIPSTIEEGVYSLQLQVTIPGQRIQTIKISDIQIIDELGKVEGWLQITGN